MMSEKIYACLAGEWHNLEEEDPECKMVNVGLSPVAWYANGAKMYAPNTRENEHTFYDYPYVPVMFKGQSYRVQPSQIQIVGE